MNTYGNKFRLSIFGESHGILIGVVLDGIPAGIPLSAEDFHPDLLRRKSGAKGTTPRIEGDVPELVSGVFEGHTTGAPLTVVFRNENTRSTDYSDFRTTPRPGHADFVAQAKHNFFNDLRGGGHFSGRLTLCLVAAGVVAKKLIGKIGIQAQIIELGGEKPETTPISAPETDIVKADSSSQTVKTPLLPSNWAALLDAAVKAGDSIGGVIECTCTHVSIGLGEPFFESLESQIAHLAFSIPAVRGIEFGDGFHAATLKGSQHNDCYINQEGHTRTNGAGGINGGISNGNPIVFRIAVKPTSSISVKQHSFNFITGQMEEMVVKGRHDACIALRCPVIVEAIAAIALANA